MLGAAAIALSVGTMGSVQAQTPTTGQQNLQPASCTQLDVGEVANRVEKLPAGTQREQLEQLVQRAREASTGGNVMQCRELLVQAESKLPGGAQVTRETPMPGFLGGEGGQGSGQSSTARGASPEQAPIQADNVVAALRNNSQFSTLAGLIERAGMADTLSRSGSYTLFAPTNAAFDKLPQNVRDQLGQEQHRDHLRAILAQHVVEGHSLASTQLPTDIKAMGGDPIDVSLTNGRPRLNIGEPQPQTQPQTRTAESTAATPAPAPTPSATNQDLTDALSALENANQALAGQGQDNQAARDQLARARQAIDRGQLQTSERQPLQQASTAIDRATQALQNNDRAAARTAVNEALPPLRQAEAATPSSANQTNRRTAAQDTTRDTTRRSTDHTPASITVGDIRTGNGYVHGIDTVLIPESVQEALVR
jgi:uncharacterized surface protein with fasciclin (FAS1) repeats